MATAQAKVQTAATPWGAAAVVEEVSVPQRAGEKRFTVVVQLLETTGGERLIRFAYSTQGAARRGPVTMRARGRFRPHRSGRPPPSPRLLRKTGIRSRGSRSREDP
ncbi:MAG TPA: hypothetical protein VIG93_07680 [Gaiellaceae bacterium]